MSALAQFIEAVAGRNVVAVVCTHGHNDHITVAPELGAAAMTQRSPTFAHVGSHSGMHPGGRL